MERIKPVDPQTAQGRTKELLDTVQKRVGRIPNMMRTMAASAPVLDGYLGFSGALGQGVLSAKAKQQLALDVGEADHCEYCLAAHTQIGKSVGLTDKEIADSRRGTSDDAKAAALLKFARAIVAKRGLVDDADVSTFRSAGHGDAEIAEVVAHVALSIFTNYFNNVAGTTVDFPKAEPLGA